MALQSPSYDPGSTLAEARELYFRHFGFDNGGYDAKWVKLKAGPIPILYFPNIEARVQAVRYHDLHHIVTEYPANWIGESEIGAWEVATGCRGFWVAWILNLDAFAIGLVIAPRKVYRAFLRGRQTGNLYDLSFDARLLSTTVAETRHRLHLDVPASSPRLRDVIAFGIWGLVSLVVVVLPPLTGLVGIGYAVLRMWG